MIFIECAEFGKPALIALPVLDHNPHQNGHSNQEKGKIDIHLVDMRTTYQGKYLPKTGASQILVLTLLRCCWI